MPVYMDRHEFASINAEMIAAAHLQDLAVQEKFGVQFLNYWFDMDRQTAFCLARGPSGEAVEAAHAASHGLIATQVIEVDEQAVELFMGKIVNHQPGEPYVETAFRTILFTDLEGSTSLTQQLGDARAMEVLRLHDSIVSDAIKVRGGSEVKHTGDGLMASYLSVTSGIASAVDMQRRLADAADPSGALARVRVGLSAGEPVTERNDLFGAAVQLAARLCQRAEPGTILASSGVRDIAVGKGFSFGSAHRLRLKGFEEPQQAYEVLWSEA
jgi:class 3 adenylate cyclase